LARLAFRQNWLSSFGEARPWKVQLHFTRTGAFQEFYGVEPPVMRGRQVTENPVGLNEHMAHFS
jgi:hypothetical protein